MLTEIIQKLLEGTFSIACDVIGSSITKLYSTENERLGQEHQQPGIIEYNPPSPKLYRQALFAAVEHHLKITKLWASQVGFADLNTVKALNNIHIELDTFLVPMRLQVDISERHDRKSLTDVLNHSQGHVVVLGSPGAGKTTSMKKLASRYFNGTTAVINQTFPILLLLRDPANYNREKPIQEFLQALFPMQLGWHPTGNVALEQKEIKETELLLNYVDELRPVLILEGLDEIPDPADRDKIIAEFRQLALRFTKAKMVLTCRSGEFKQYVYNTSVFEISPLTRAQVREFAFKWLSSASAASKFCTAAFASPYPDTTMRPLIVAHLCAIYERIGTIPEKPKTVYKKVVYLLLEEWDQQRSIERRSRYAHFEVDRKLEFLSSIAFRLTAIYGRAIFSRRDISRAYNEVARSFKLPLTDVELVTTEIESHTGLLVQSGADSFEFSHKSIQEYLTAEYLVRSPSFDAFKAHNERLPTEFAIATTIASDSTRYLATFVLGYLVNEKPTRTFFTKYLTRLTQESVDLYTSQDATLAVLIMNALSASASDLKRIAFDCFGASAPRWVSEYYNTEKAEKDFIKFTGKKSHPMYRLPEVFYIHESEAEVLGFKFEPGPPPQ